MLVPTRWLTSQGLRTIIVVVPASLFGWYLLTTALSSSSLDTTPSAIFHTSPFRGGSRPSTKPTENSFIKQLLDNDLNPQFVGTALTEVCKSKRWKSGLIFSCDPAEGGIGNIRNIILNCVRYAIEAGGKCMHRYTGCELIVYSNAISSPNSYTTSETCESQT